MKAPILNIENLSYQISAKYLLRDINLSVGKNEHIAIVGINGAGKSTLFKAIMKLIHSRHGVIEIGGESLAQMNRQSLARHVSYVPQTLSFSADFTVRDYLMMSCFSQSNTNSADKVSETLTRLHLEKYAEISVMSLSGGERQRISIAAAIVQEAQIMLLDEPTAHLDLYQAAKVKHWLKEVETQENLTTLTITHDLNWLASEFDRAVCLKEGILCYDGPAAELLEAKKLEQYFDITAEIIYKPDGTPVIAESYPQPPNQV